GVGGRGGEGGGAARGERVGRGRARGGGGGGGREGGGAGVSGRGGVLVRRAAEEGVQGVPVPGPNAAVAAVSISGFPEGRFHFAGFLPRKATQRSQMLLELRPLRSQLVFYEAPQRLADTPADLRADLGD